MIKSTKLSPGERDEFAKMLPPDNYEPEWKKQFKMMDRHRSNRERAQQIAFFGVGFLMAAFVPGLYELKVAVLVGLVIWFAACATVAIKTHLSARDIDRKLDEEVRVEKG